MIQRGIVIGNTTPLNIDDLRYSYATLSNKLLAVTDASTAVTANGKQGDFADGTNAGDDYVYDDNGNLVIDLNKNVKELNNTAGANGIVYNFLDKPEQINLKGKGKITIVYDADGNKLQKIFTPIAPTNSTLEVGNNFGTPITTTYINGFVYKADKLQFISTEEGRLRIIQATNTNNGYDNIQIDGTETMPTNGPNPPLGGRGTFDFFVRDYQSNVRMVLTEETHKGSNICTMETNRAANEEPIFGKTDANGVPMAGNEVQARFAASSIPGQAVGNGWAEPNIGNYVAKLYKGRRSTIGTDMGPASLLKVMAGDKVSATTIYYYQNPVANTTDNTSAINSILSSLTAAIGSSPVAGDAVHGAAGSITSNLGGSVPFTNITSPDAGNPAGTNPKAYLTVIFFDERFNFVPEASTTQRVQSAGNGQAPLVIADAKAPKNGYAYIYISNESAEPVYFDNLRVVHERGRITEENHYYAYGLKIAGISSTKAGDVNERELKNKYLYNEKELWDEADLNWYDYGFRNYDPQIGRFPQLDPLTWDYPELTNYQYASCDPITNIDIDGLEGGTVLKGAVTVAGKTTMAITAPVATYTIIKKTVTTVITEVAKRPGFWEELGWFILKAGPRVAGTISLLFVSSDAGVGSVPNFGKRPWEIPAPENQPKPENKPENKPDDDDDDDDDIYLYRGGSFTDVNFTPAVKDASEGPKQGWSTFLDPTKATQGKGGKYQILSVKKLAKCGFGFKGTNDGHVGIVPKSKAALKAWAASKEPLKAGQGGTHRLTKILKKCRVREAKL